MKEMLIAVGIVFIVVCSVGWGYRLGVNECEDRGTGKAAEALCSGAVDAGDRPSSASVDADVTPNEAWNRYSKQAWLCDKQLGGELFRKHTSSNFEPKGLAAFCLLRPLQGVGSETDARIKELESKCVDVGGKFVGQTHKLDVMCDLSNVK